MAAYLAPLREVGPELLEPPTTSVNEEMTSCVVVAMLMNHILPLYVSQLSKSVPSPQSVGEDNIDQFLLFEKESSTSGIYCSKCRYFENLAFSSSFNKYCQQVNCSTCTNNCHTPTNCFEFPTKTFESYHNPIMVLPTSNNNLSHHETNTNTNSQYVREYLLNSLFQTDLDMNTLHSTNNEQTQNDKNYFLSNEGSLADLSMAPKNMVFPDKNRKNQAEKKATMTILPQTNQNVNQLHVEAINNTNSSEEDASTSSCLSNSSTFSNRSFKRESFVSKERSWKVAFESEEYKGLLRNTSFKIKTRTDDIEMSISSQLYSSLKYQFNISTFINKKRATELDINQKSYYGGIIIATIESLVVKSEDEEYSDEENLKDEVCEDVLKGESELALQPIESIEATESKAFKPFLQQLRREISKDDNDCDEREWMCLLNKTKMQFSDQSQHNKKNSYVMRVSFYLNKEFKERKPIIIFESAPFKIYARRSKKLDESEEPKKRKRKTKSKTTSKKQKSEIALLSKFETELRELVQFIGGMTNSTEKDRAVQSFITNLVSIDNQDRKQSIEPIYIDTSFGRQLRTEAKLLNERVSELNNPFFDPFYGNFSRDDNSLESSISKDMLLSIGQSSVLDSPHTTDLMKSESKPQNRPPRILQLLNQPSSRLDLSKVKNIGSMNPSMLNKYLQDDVQTPTIMNSQSNNLIGMENSLDIFDVSPLPIQGNINNILPNETNTFDQLLFDLHRSQTKKEK